MVLVAGTHSSNLLATRWSPPIDAAVQTVGRTQRKYREDVDQRLLFGGLNPVVSETVLSGSLG